MKAVAERLKDMPHVLGFDTLNEPSAGWIGVRMSDRRDETTAAGPALPGIAWCAVNAPSQHSRPTLPANTPGQSSCPTLTRPGKKLTLLGWCTPTLPHTARPWRSCTRRTATPCSCLRWSSSCGVWAFCPARSRRSTSSKSPSGCQTTRIRSSPLAPTSSLAVRRPWPRTRARTVEVHCRRAHPRAPLAPDPSLALACAFTRVPCPCLRLHPRPWPSLVPSSPRDADKETPFRVLKDNFFRVHADGRPVNLNADVYFPFFNRVADAVHAIRDDWLIFAEREPMTFAKPTTAKDIPHPSGYVNAAHWCTALVPCPPPRPLPCPLPRRFANDARVSPWAPQMTAPCSGPRRSTGRSPSTW